MASTRHFAVGFPIFDPNELEAFGNLIVVGAEGPRRQVPIVFPGANLSPAGLNGQFPAA